MNPADHQIPIDISGSSFPQLLNNKGRASERFWYVKDEFIKHSQDLLANGRVFSDINARLVNDRWVCAGRSVSNADIAWFVGKLRLFYMKSESMSIHSLCMYMETNVGNANVRLFFQHMRESWVEHLGRTAVLFGDYVGPIKTNKQLIDALLYSGNFHSQEKHKRRYDDLLRHMDESLIVMCAYNALHSTYQMNHISRAISELREDNLIILLPDLLRHEWAKTRP